MPRRRGVIASYVYSSPLMVEIEIKGSGLNGRWHNRKIIHKESYGLIQLEIIFFITEHFVLQHLWLKIYLERIWICVFFLELNLHLLIIFRPGWFGPVAGITKTTDGMTLVAWFNIHFITTSFVVVYTMCSLWSHFSYCMLSYLKLIFIAFLLISYFITSVNLFDDQAARGISRDLTLRCRTEGSSISQ